MTELINTGMTPTEEVQDGVFARLNTFCQKFVALDKFTVEQMKKNGKSLVQSGSGKVACIHCLHLYLMTPVPAALTHFWGGEVSVVKD